MYISHGSHDRVLRIDYCSRRLVPHLEVGWGLPAAAGLVLLLPLGYRS